MFGLFEKKPEQRAAEALYDAIVDQARSPALYRLFGTPDTVEGRFESLILHVYLVLRRFRGGGPEAEAVGQRLFDRLFKDLDDNMREIGVGDLTVPKKVKGLVAAFYGHVAAYDKAFEEEDEAALSEALTRNVYAGDAPGQRALEGLTTYAKAQSAALADQPLPRMLNGIVRFMSVEETLENARA